MVLKSKILLVIITAILTSLVMIFCFKFWLKTAPTSKQKQLNIVLDTTFPLSSFVRSNNFGTDWEGKQIPEYDLKIQFPKGWTVEKTKDNHVILVKNSQRYFSGFDWQRSIPQIVFGDCLYSTSCAIYYASPQSGTLKTEINGRPYSLEIAQKEWYGANKKWGQPNYFTFQIDSPNLVPNIKRVNGTAPMITGMFSSLGDVEEILEILTTAQILNPTP